jgi:CRP-like cAMP-binding protein
MIDPARIAKLPLFASARPAAVSAIAQHATERAFAADEVLFSAGAASKGLFVVLEGTVRVVRVGDGRRHVVHTETAGGTLGEVPLFDGGSYPATAIAAEPTRCLVLDRDAIRRAIVASPDVALVFLARLAARVRTLVDRLDDRSARSVNARLAEFMLSRAHASNGKTFSLGMTQTALAEELGTVREVVVRGLRDLIQRGLVTSRGKERYEVTDGAALQALSRQSQKA